MKLPESRSHISTENRNPRSMDMHEWSVDKCVANMVTEEEYVQKALESSQKKLTAFIEMILPKFRTGGRLIYIGAGTSGRLGVLDASELPPTYQLEPGRIIGLIAGGDKALRLSSEGKEDDYNGSHEELDNLKLNENDAILGIAAGGTTPYVVGALEYFKQTASNGITGLLSCAQIEAKPFIDALLIVDTGPELVTGSTRMKAGTVTKLILNIISTTLMVQIGRIHENLMIDMKASNEKLIDRAIRMIGALTGLEREASFKLLLSANNQVKPALMMFFEKVELDIACEIIKKNEGRLKLKEDNI
ncbi:MAG: N-acetylmuramic acid 6-phosphate etherase [Planctomycetota bacterium]|nr:MAG: N-acetylmuramic acid 6-phosphate etherase [Planctomycetota bacterium]